LAFNIPPIAVLQMGDYEAIQRPYGELLLLSGRGRGVSNLQLLLLRIRPGAATRLHRHSYDECYFVVRGKGHILTGESEWAVGTGEAIIVPPHAPHKISSDLGRVWMEAIVAISPPRSPGSVTYLE
jgi:mannose-6-phosphate isomerase-like protein (cupin superfamily)